MIYSPSLACADQLNLEKDIQEITECGIEWLHFDIMDGHYVPNLCLSFDTLKAINSKFRNALIDVHIMVTNPESYIQRLSELGANNVAFHTDSTSFSLRTIQLIHKNSMKAGVVLNPSQTVSHLMPILSEVDYVLVMSIEPGFSGQKFIESTFEKITELTKIRSEHQLNFQISVDGGITPEIGKKLLSLGADILVLGFPAIFNQVDGISGSFQRFKSHIERQV